MRSADAVAPQARRNRYGRSWDFALPTGGYKRSGIGKNLGRHAYETNLRTKTVLIDFAANPA